MSSILILRSPLVRPRVESRISKITNGYTTIFPRKATPMEYQSTAGGTESSAAALVQYVVLRRDLIDQSTLGSAVAVGCRASIAAVWENKDDPHTVLYCSPPNQDSMRKVTLEIKGETEILKLSEKLKDAGIPHKLWIEQPKNIPSGLATQPCLKSNVSSFFKKLKLCSAPKGYSSIDSQSTIQGLERSAADTMVQCVILRRDLIDTWPLGSVITQGCHASIAAIWMHKDDPDTVLYCSPHNLDFMHKVILEVQDDAEMVNLSARLNRDGIAHKLWVEQPENIPTCLAMKPYPESIVWSLLVNLHLCK